MEPSLNFVLLGGKRAGKSASGNTILGQEAFVSKKSSKLVTRDVAVVSGTVFGFPVTVHDTPGFCDSELSEDEVQQMINEKVLLTFKPGPYVFLLVIKADSFTEEERKTVEKIEQLLGEERLKKTWILFTKGDELEDENMTIKEFINESDPLEKLMQKYHQRFHVFNNKKIKPNRHQARILLTKILQRSLGLKASDGGRLMRQNHDEQQTTDSLSSTRIVLLGKTGVGKSAAGNIILGDNVFKSEQSMDSVSRDCLEKCATVSGRSVSVVDTPGFFDTQMKHEELTTEIARSVYLSSPGPHAFLIVFPVNMRFTEQEQQIADLVEIMFGEEVLKYSIILFTHGDLLVEPLHELIKQNCRLRDLVDQCGGRFHVFNNEAQNNREQVNDLLQKIDSMIEQNGGGHYSNQMFEDAQRLRREEEERRQREEEEEIERTIEVQKDPEFEQFYRQYETRFNVSAVAVHKYSPTEIGAIWGATIGGILGILGGPIGVIVVGSSGAALGAAIGVTIGNYSGSK